MMVLVHVCHSPLQSLCLRSEACSDICSSCALNSTSNLFMVMKPIQSACFFCHFPPATFQAAGVIMLPEQAQGPGIALPSPADRVCFMYLLNDSGAANQSTASHANGSTSQTESTGELGLSASAPRPGSKQACSLLVFCQLAMQPERATSWMRGLLQVVQAQHVVVIASLPVSLPLHVHGRQHP